MSEAERKRRQEYKKNRKKWIFGQLIAVGLVFLIACASFLTYFLVNREYYISYTEDGKINYEVSLFDNDFYEEGTVGQDKAYIASLINKITADMKYELRMEADEVGFDYSHDVIAEVQIVDKDSGKIIYNPSEELVKKTTKSVNGKNRISIRETVDIDFVKYNELATSFVKTYGAKNAVSTLVVKMNVNVLSRCEEFEENSDNSYSIAMNVPLNVNTVNINLSSSVPTAESKVLACKGSLNLDSFKTVGIASSVVDLVLIVLLIAFIYVTRNEDINYTRRVQKLVSAYRSFIQEMYGEFDVTGYQLIRIKTFGEMLGIRDTIQSPILMSENEDQTRTQFFIPTNTKLLYIFEIKVDNYDEIYGINDNPENPTEPTEPSSPESEAATEPVTAVNEANVPAWQQTVKEFLNSKPKAVEKETLAEEAAVIAEDAEVVPEVEAIPEVEEAPAVEETPEVEETPAVEEAPTVAFEAEIPDEKTDVAEESEPVSLNISEELYNAYIAEADFVLEDTESSVSDEDEDSDEDEGTFAYYDKYGTKLDIRCRRSCLANIIQSNNETIKKYYSELKNYILSYKTVKARMSWRYETYKKGRYQLFRLKIRGKTICLYCALNPAEFDTNKYFHEASDAKMFEQVPMLIRIRSDRGLKKAKELIDITMQKFGLTVDSKAKTVDYIAEHPYERTQALIDKELIKVLIPDGYVAIDPYHIVRAEKLLELEAAAKAVKAAEEKQQLENAVEEAMKQPDVSLDEIDFVDEVDEAYTETNEHPGVDVVSVVWPERPHGNKVYRYDPNGEIFEEGDIVLVPTTDKHKNREVVRKAAVAHGNHKVDPEHIKHPLKKIIRLVRRKLEVALSGNTEKKSNTKKK